jgi:hypothetical protein
MEKNPLQVIESYPVGKDVYVLENLFYGSGIPFKKGDCIQIKVTIDSISINYEKLNKKGTRWSVEPQYSFVQRHLWADHHLTFSSEKQAQIYAKKHKLVIARKSWFKAIPDKNDYRGIKYKYEVSPILVPR